jgi:hypothetical protein
VRTARFFPSTTWLDYPKVPVGSSVSQTALHMHHLKVLCLTNCFPHVFSPFNLTKMLHATRHIHHLQAIPVHMHSLYSPHLPKIIQVLLLDFPLQQRSTVPSRAPRSFMQYTYNSNNTRRPEFFTKKGLYKPWAFKKKSLPYIPSFTPNAPEKRQSTGSFYKGVEKIWTDVKVALR